MSVQIYSLLLLFVLVEMFWPSLFNQFWIQSLQASRHLGKPADTWWPCSSLCERCRRRLWTGRCGRAPPAHMWEECHTQRSSRSPKCRYKPEGHLPAAKQTGEMSVEVKTCKNIVYAKRSRHAYAKFLYTSLWRLWVIPQFDHGHNHWLIKNDIHSIYLETIIYKSQVNTLWMIWKKNSSLYQSRQNRG